MNTVLRKIGIVAGATAATLTVSTLAFADKANAMIFFPLDLSGLQPITSAPGDLLGPTAYFGDRNNDGLPDQMGTFTVVLESENGALDTRPVGNAEGDLVMGVEAGTPPRDLVIKFVFEPLNGLSRLLPAVKLTQVDNGSSGPDSPFNPFADPTDNFAVEAGEGTTTSWLLNGGDPQFIDNSSGTTAAWTYGTPGNPKVASSDVPFEYISDGSVGTLLITYTSEGQFLNNGAFNMSTAYVPTPALLPGLIGMGAAALRKRKQEAVEQEA